MKILFIYPNTGSQLGFNYGVAHLSAVLKAAGHEVILWHLCEELAPLPSEAQLAGELQRLAPDIVGFSVVTNQWAYTRQIARWVRRASSAALVCGGIHAMAAPQEILQTGLFDYIMRGESEDALLEFVERLAAGGDLRALRNLGFIENGEVRLNPVRALPDLKKLPFKDYSIFDFQKIIDAKNGWVGLMASRGCPFSCTYCFNHQMVKHYRQELNCSMKQLNYIRHFEVAEVVGEIKFLLENYTNIRMLIFDDDLFTFYGDYVQQFCSAYRQVADLPFVVNAHVNFFDEDRAHHLAQANCKIVKFGVESGSERIRKQVMRRHMTNAAIRKAIQTAHKEGLHTSVFLMIGLPGETREDVVATIRLMAEAKPGRYRWTFFYPYPDTDAYRLTAKLGYIDQTEMSDLQNFTDRSCLDFGEDQNLFLQKVGKIMPWFVNAYSDLAVADFYRKKVDEIVSLDRPQWEQRAEQILEEDQALSEGFAKKGLRHYAIKYNRFMAVISDFFIEEAQDRVY